MTQQTDPTPTLAQQVDQADSKLLGGGILAMAMAAFIALAFLGEDPNLQPKHQFWNSIAWLFPVPGLLLGLTGMISGWRQRRRIDADYPHHHTHYPPTCCHQHTSCCHRH